MIAPLSRHSLQSVPEDSTLMPPPECQSSMIQKTKKKQRKRKCESDNLEVDQVPQSSSLNSTDVIPSSINRNSREISYMSQENVRTGKRSRKERLRK